MATQEQWLTKLANLHVYRAKRGAAPHKPLLMLVLFELAERGELPPDALPLTAELAFRFTSYWSIVAHRRTQAPDVRMPFHHLQNDGFWSALGEDTKPSPDDRLTRYAQVVFDFATCLKDPVFRDQGRRILIAKYFEPNERVRLTTISSGSIVDAAHIHQFSASRNNDPQNGLALCKNAHWLFDNGLWTISDDYTVLVAVERFTEDSPNQTPLSAFHGRKLVLPADRTLWPNPTRLAWHRKHKFQMV